MNEVELEMFAKKMRVIGLLGGVHAQLSLLSLEAEDLSIIAEIEKAVILIETIKDQLEEETVEEDLDCDIDEDDESFKEVY